MRIFMAILSIQSHVAYGYVGNKAAVYPLQSMGHEVWPVNTVQFSNHTGYGKWQGEVFSRAHIRNVIKGFEDLGIVQQCDAILSGYMGSREIAEEVQETVDYFKSKHPNLIYLCDPVIGSTSCFVKPEVFDFFKTQLRADIITPNQFEAESLSDIKINSSQDIKKVAEYFHDLGVKIVVITGLKLPDVSPDALYVYISFDNTIALIKVKEYAFAISPNGTGDLFSAVFLGAYILTNNPLESLQRTVFLTDQVMKNTFDSKGRELKVISVNYSNFNVKNLPPVITL